MLERADLEIVRRDTRLGGLATLLDPDAFLECLNRMGSGRVVETASPQYVRYKPHTSCIVSYRIRVEGRDSTLYARCHADDRAVKLANVRARAEARGELGDGLLADRETGIAVFVYPNDYEIRALHKLYEEDRKWVRMRRMLPAHAHLYESVPITLRHKPERRFVAKLSGDGGPSAVLRLYPEDAFSEVRARSWAFHNAGGLHVPRIIGDSARYCSLAHEWVEGENLSALVLDDADGTDALGEVASALQALQSQRPNLGTMYSAADYCRAVRGATDALRTLGEDFGSLAEELRKAIEAQVLSGEWRSQAVHGDFTPDQVLLGRDGVTILDLDRAGYGDPGMDVGSFAAWLLAAEDDGRLAGGLGHAMAGEFIRLATGADPRDSAVAPRAFVAGALLMMAPEPFRYRHAQWPARVSALLDCADRVLQSEAIDA